jgi:Flp pilus assembly protein TadB
VACHQPHGDNLQHRLLNNLLPGLSSTLLLLLLLLWLLLLLLWLLRLLLLLWLRLLWLSLLLLIMCICSIWLLLGSLEELGCQVLPKLLSELLIVNKADAGVSHEGC